MAQTKHAAAPATQSDSTLIDPVSKGWLAALSTAHHLMRKAGPGYAHEADKVQEVLHHLASQPAAVESTLQVLGFMPTVVIEQNDHSIACVRSNVPVRVICIDEDTEDADDEDIVAIGGTDYHLNDFVLEKFNGNGRDGVDPDWISLVREQVDDQRAESDGCSSTLESPK